MLPLTGLKPASGFFYGDYKTRANVEA